MMVDWRMIRNKSNSISTLGEEAEVVEEQIYGCSPGIVAELQIEH